MNTSNRWRTFTAAPHRMFFFGGVLQAVITLVWWMADLVARYGGLYAPPSWSISPLDAHAFLMIYTFFPYFIFGFLMTTYPRWMNGETIERHHYVPAFLMMWAGTLLFYAGLLTNETLVSCAVLVLLAGWSTGLFALLQVYVRATHPDKRHALITAIVLTLGALLIAGFLTDNATLIRVAKTGGVWVFLLPAFFAVSHRMIPFFSANVIRDYEVVRPAWVLAFVPAGALAHAVLDMVGAHAWTWLVDIPLAVSALYLTQAWQIRKALAIPLLGMLHIGFAWLGVAMMLYGMQSLALLVTPQLILGKAPLHALTIGYFTSMVLAMVTRVSLGHSGHPLIASRLLWWMFLTFQIVPVLRVISELPRMDFTTRGYLYLCAGAVWLVCMGQWALRFAPIYWKKRIDGQEG
jgi:uncharacterized protein involved in response to NO